MVIVHFFAAESQERRKSQDSLFLCDGGWNYELGKKFLGLIFLWILMRIFDYEVLILITSLLSNLLTNSCSLLTVSLVKSGLY